MLGASWLAPVNSDVSPNMASTYLVMENLVSVGLFQKFYCCIAGWKDVLGSFVS